MKLDMLRTFCQAIFLLVLPMLLACGDDSLQTEETLSEIRAQNSGRYVPNAQIDDPPENPCLADSSWSIGHANSYAQASSSWAGPAWKIAEQTEDFILNPNTGVFIFSGPYPDGSRVIWIQGPTRLTKIDPNGSRMRVIDSVETKPPLWPAHIKMDAVGKMSNKTFSMILSKMELEADIERREGEAPYGIDGVYILLDNEGTLFQGIGKEVVAYGDEVEGDRLSKIKVKRRYQIPADQLTREWDRVIGLGMTFDGMLAFVTNYGTVGVIDRAFKNARYLKLGKNEYVFNSIAIDEDGGIYIITHKRIHRVQWTGEKLSLDKEEGGWSAEYETGWSDSGKFAKGTGATPTLMNSSDGEKFLVFPDGQKVMNIVLFWRDKIPADWTRIPGTKDRRIAAQVPITFGYPEPEASWTENSAVVRGNGIFVVNNQLKDYEGMNAAQRIVIAGEPGHAPYGIEKFQWDSESRILKSVWSNKAISLPTSTPCVSSATNLIYGAGQRDGTWTLEAIDWDTGESVFYYEVGDRVRHNSGMSTVAIGPDSSIYYGTFLGLIRIRPS